MMSVHEKFQFVLKGARQQAICYDKIIELSVRFAHDCHDMALLEGEFARLPKCRQYCRVNFLLALLHRYVHLCSLPT